MKKKELFAFVHGAACGADLTTQLDTEEGQLGFKGLGHDLGSEAFGFFIQTLKNRFDGDYEIFEPSNMGNFDSVPSATNYIWKHKENLSPWFQSVKDEVSE